MTDETPDWLRLFRELYERAEAPTLRYLTDATGISHSNIGHYLQGKTHPKRARLEMLTGVLAGLVHDSVRDDPAVDAEVQKVLTAFDQLPVHRGRPHSYQVRQPEDEASAGDRRLTDAIKDLAAAITKLAEAINNKD